MKQEYLMVGELRVTEEEGFVLQMRRWVQSRTMMELERARKEIEVEIVYRERG